MYKLIIHKQVQIITITIQFIVVTNLVCTEYRKNNISKDHNHLLCHLHVQYATAGASAVATSRRAINIVFSACASHTATIRLAVASNHLQKCIRSWW